MTKKTDYRRNFYLCQICKGKLIDQSGATKAQKVAVIWADWNERKITGNEAIYEIKKLFPRAALKEWRKRMEKIEFSVMEVKV